MNSRLSLLCGVVVVALGIAGCSSGGSGGSNDGDQPGGDQPPVSQLPSARIIFPSANARLDADEGAITVRGTATDGDSGIRLIAVNGVGATSSDGFATWEVQIPLTPGDNTLTVEATDDDGNIDANAAQSSIRVEPLMDTGDDVFITLDIDNNRALLIDHIRILSLDLTTRIRSIFSSSNIGNGPSISAPTHATIDRVNNRLLLIDERLDALVAIDLSTGDRSILSDADTGSGVSLQGAFTPTVNEDGSEVYLSNVPRDEIIAINLATGDRRIISDSTTGAGPVLGSPLNAALYDEGLLVLDFNSPELRLVSVDLTSGDRTVLANNLPRSRSRFSLAFDADTNRALFTNGSDSLYGIDIASGNLTVLSTPGSTGIEPREAVGQGVALKSIGSITLDSNNNQVIVTDRFLESVATIDLATGDRSITSDNKVGEGLEFSSVGDMAFDSANSRILLAMSENGAPITSGNTGRLIMAVDLDTGNRSTFTGNDVGSGPNFDGFGSFLGPRSIEIDSQRNRALVTDTSRNAIFEVNLLDGARSIIADATTGSGTFIGIGNIIFNGDNNAIYFASDFIGQINLLNGERTMLSSDGIGLEPPVGSGPIDRLGSDAVLIDSNRLLVLDKGLDAILEVDIATGNRSIFSGNGLGLGPNIDSPENMIIDSNNNRLLLTNNKFRFADVAGESLLSVDIESGNRVDLASDDYEFYENVFSLEFDSENNILFSFELYGGLYATDLTTGERVLFSHF